MDLADFVSQSIVQIVAGVKAAQDQVKDLKGKVNPAGLAGGSQAFSEGMRATVGGATVFAQVVEFDVAVTVGEGKDAKAGIGIFAGGVGIGTQGGIQTENSVVSRLRFKIPVICPSDPTEPRPHLTW